MGVALIGLPLHGRERRRGEEKGSIKPRLLMQ